MEPVPATELIEQRAFLRRLARGVVGDDALAEDVVAEAELRALERGPGSTGPLRAWLATVTRRLALNARRARERRALHEAAGARREAVPGPDEALSGLELQQGVLAALRALDEPLRTVLWQRYYEDRTPAEIAARLGAPLATVKTRLRRGLAELRAALDRSHGGRREAWSASLVALARAPQPLGMLPLTLGGLGMKKLACGIGLLCVAWLGWRSWPTREPMGVRPERDPSVTLPAALSPEEPAATASVPAREASRGAPAPLTAAPLERVEHATLAVHATWAEDGTDAAEIGLTLWPLDDDRPDLAARVAETDALGRVRLADVAAGRYRLHSDRGTETALELAAGEEHRLALALPAGLDVLGRVLDGEQNPVAGADVWLEGGSTGLLGGRVVTRARADGTFRLRALQRELSLGAFAPGFAPAHLARLDTRTPTAGEREVRVTLVLDRAGETLRGRVLDAAGRPVPGARLALGSSGNRVSGDTWQPRARMLATDAEGRFAADWVAPREERLRELWALHVLAPEHALAFVSEEEVRAALGNELVVSLTRGATLAGRVSDASGNALAGVRVAVRADPEAVERHSPFQLPHTRTRADGSYELVHVAAGEVRLVATLEADATQGVDESRFVTEGARERWDLVLGPAPVLRGRVIDADGRGLAERSVLCESVGGGTVITSDADGGFVFAPTIRGEEWTLSLVGPSGIVDRRSGLRLGTEVVLVERVHAGRVVGGFSDRAGLAVEGEQVLATLKPDEEGMFVQAELDAQGAFLYEGVAPGRYRVTIASGERELAWSPWFELFEGATVTLDWLESGGVRPVGGE